MPKSTSFECINCNRVVSIQAPGTKNRNHCPYCLFSRHVDEKIGDRQSKCMGSMEAIGKIYKNDGEEVLIHKCSKCSFVRKNRIAGDDSWDLVDHLPDLTEKLDDLSSL